MNLKTVPRWNIIVLVEISKWLPKEVISSTPVYFVPACIGGHTTHNSDS